VDSTTTCASCRRRIASSPTRCQTAIRSIVSAGVINDLTADSKGGVYFTHGGLFYADPKGVVKQYGEGLRTNGVVLSPDEKVVYVTNGNSVAAFDVQADGSLTNQRVFVMLPSGGGDGMTIDSQGRLSTSPPVPTCMWHRPMASCSAASPRP
jgi:hypothetical protein